MLLFMDGMAHYDSASLATKYSTVGLAEVVWSVVPEGRFGMCLKRVSTSNAAGSGSLTISPLTTRVGGWLPTASGVCGFAVKIDDLTRVSSASAPLFAGLITIHEGTITHLSLTLNGNGTFTLRTESAFAESDHVLAQSSEGLSSGTWMFVEMQWVIHATDGMCEVRVNGVPVLSHVGRTRTPALGSPALGVWNAVRLLAMTSTATPPLLVARMSDVYLADLVTAAPADVSGFLGDGTVLTIRPNGVGAASGWTSSGGANWDMTNDTVPDGDTTTVTASLVGARDLYQFEDISDGVEVKAAHVNILARKLEEGSAGIAPVVYQGASAFVGPMQGVTSLTYDHYVTQPYDLNPATGNKFTATEINNGQFGMDKVQ